MGRRLGNGASFYGKRKSSFYGEDDSNRKADPDVFSEEEDWRGPGGGSYCALFAPMPSLIRLFRPMCRAWHALLPATPPLPTRPRSLAPVSACRLLLPVVLSKECDEQGRPLGFLTRKEAREQKLADEAAARDSTETLAQFAEAANRDDGDRISE